MLSAPADFCGRGPSASLGWPLVILLSHSCSSSCLCLRRLTNSPVSSSTTSCLLFLRPSFLVGSSNGLQPFVLDVLVPGLATRCLGFGSWAASVTAPAGLIPAPASGSAALGLCSASALGSRFAASASDPARLLRPRLGDRLGFRSLRLARLQRLGASQLLRLAASADSLGASASASPASAALLLRPQLLTALSAQQLLRSASSRLQLDAPARPLPPPGSTRRLRRFLGSPASAAS